MNLSGGEISSCIDSNWETSVTVPFSTYAGFQKLVSAFLLLHILLLLPKVLFDEKTYYAISVQS